jgi:hypothetical protein
MKYTQYMRMSALLAGLMLVAGLLACNNSSAPFISSAPARKTSKPDMADAKRLSDGASKLMDAMEKPTRSFHFSFKGYENINNKYPQDKTQAPQVGPVALQADVSPEEIDLTETRGLTTKTSKARKGEDINWAMANLTTLGVMTSPNFVIVVGASVVSPPSIDLVGATPADKFTFDTTIATPSQKRGLEAARAVLTTIRDCKGTAWIAKDSGLLVKFDIDADYLDKNGHAWKEHYEGEVTPK